MQQETAAGRGDSNISGERKYFRGSFFLIVHDSVLYTPRVSRRQRDSAAILYLNVCVRARARARSCDLVYSNNVL